MVGAGVFAAFAPAAEAAGAGLLLALAIAALVAFCNATSSARLAAVYPESGGTYVYGRERLGDFFGYLAGWGFIVGKTASCAAMALTVGYYVDAPSARPIAVAAVAALTALKYFGVHKSALACSPSACSASPQPCRAGLHRVGPRRVCRRDGRGRGSRRHAGSWPRLRPCPPGRRRADRRGAGRRPLCKPSNRTGRRYGRRDSPRLPSLDMGAQGGPPASENA